MKTFYFLIFCILFGLNVSAQASTIVPNKYVYSVGENITLSLQRSTTETIVTQLKDISTSGEPLLVETTWNANETQKSVLFLTLAHKNKAIGIYVKEGSGTSNYVGYVRVTESGNLTTYTISKEAYQGLDIFKLDGGMSAEYAVEKSLTNLCKGVSHTWVADGGGPRKVWGAPNFLQKSIEKTVQLYNENLGSTTSIETVIISTGVPNVPYLSAALKAPVLPLHFLVSVNACKEIKSILDYSNSNGYSSYATLGYDGSMSGAAVAWIKLLDLPQEYKQFIIDHNVQNVILLGIGQTVAGESYSRKITTTGSAQDYTPGTIYMLYTNYGSQSDINSLKARLIDYDQQPLGDGKLISDWESGIVNNQLLHFGNSIENNTSADSYALISNGNMIDMYNFASYTMLKMINKNQSTLTSPYVKGIILNEYLISQPYHELVSGQIPMLYWQMNPAASTIDRVDGYLTQAINSFYPSVTVKSLPVHINGQYGKSNLETELRNRNYVTITKRPDNVPEVWNTTNGMTAPCESVAQNIVSVIGVNNYKTKLSNITPLTIAELKTLTGLIPGLWFDYSRKYLSGSFDGGTGTAEFPFQVATAEQLALVKNNVSAHYKLTADIDMASVSFTARIGTFSAPFTGSFDGNGKKISNLTMSVPGGFWTGLFNYAKGATIKNLNLQNVSLSAGAVAGALVGQIDGGTIENCTVTGTINCTGNSIGALLGCSYYTNPAIIRNCVIDAQVSGVRNVGLLVGNCCDKTSISKCILKGSVTGTARIGAVTGYDGTDDKPSMQTTNSVTGVVVSSLVLGSTAATPEVASINRIIGYSRGVTLSQNYALHPGTVFSGITTRAFVSNAAGNDGENKGESDLLGSTFYTNLNYLFGNSESEPWAISTGIYPHLWYNNTMVARTLLDTPVRQQKCSIYPNPVVDILTVEGKNISKLVLSTLTGLVLDEVCDSKLDMTHVLPGNYVLTIITDTATETTIITKK